MQVVEGERSRTHKRMARVVVREVVTRVDSIRVEGIGAVAEIHIPGQHSPQTIAVGIAVDVIVLDGTVDILNDYVGRHVVDLSGQVDVVFEEVFEVDPRECKTVNQCLGIRVIFVSPRFLLQARVGVAGESIGYDFVQRSFRIQIVA